MDKSASLLPKHIAIVENKGTERPHSGKYTSITRDIVGTYLCKQCGLALFRSDSKFISSCGWPSFDQQICNNVKQALDKDKIRTEILCMRCDAHLGHIFHGEQLTINNTRYCINSLSLEFIKNNITVTDSEEAIVAAGCFWGVEYLLKQIDGVLLTEVGYTGGDCENPNYTIVCQGKTKHVEAVRVIYDPRLLSYKKILKIFFEIHNFEQINGQGPDIGEQYLSKVFYYDQQQKVIATDLINELNCKQFQVATTIHPVGPFWPAEEYHQDYYVKNHKQPYCHERKAIW